MNAIVRRPLSVATGLTLAVIVTVAFGATALAGGNGTHWVAPLSGSQEVPAVVTQGTGVAKFKLSKDGESIHYKLNVANIENVIQSHIHVAPAGTNGGVVAFLFGPVIGGVSVNGTLIEGTITSADLKGSLAGQDLSALVAALESGNTYVNVHTVANPSGEIRGQIK